VEKGRGLPEKEKQKLLFAHARPQMLTVIEDSVLACMRGRKRKEEKRA